MNIRKFLWCDCGVKFKNLAPLVLRLAVGSIFLVHGYTKFTSGIPAVADFLGALAFPTPDIFAPILIAVEVLGGVALILGFFTHWAAKLTSIVALLALLTVHLGNGFWVQNNGYEFALLLLAGAISLSISGAGRWSLDALISGEEDLGATL